MAMSELNQIYFYFLGLKDIIVELDLVLQKVLMRLFVLILNSDTRWCWGEQVGVPLI